MSDSTNQGTPFLKEAFRPLRKGEQYCTRVGCWNSAPAALCGHCRPKPPAKRKAFKRWTYAGSGWAMQDSLLVFRGSEADVKFLIRKLNAARVSLPTGRKAKP